MSDTKYTDASGAAPGTLVIASWLNDVNTAVYTALVSVAGTNTITATGATTVTTAYPRGVAFRFLPINTNTGPATINISGLGAKNITKFGNAPLAAGDLLVGSWAYLTYDGVQFQLINAGGPLTGVDTYVTTAGTTTAYTLTFQGSFGFFAGYAVKLIFNATNTSTTPTLNVNGSGAVACKVMDANGNKIDPIVGAFAANTPATAIYDGVNWLVVVEYPTGRLLNIQRIGASGTYTPTPGTTSAIVEVIGGGGQGGGSTAPAAGQVSCGGGGGGGGYAQTRVTNPTITTVTVGLGGSTGGAGAAGQAGGTTSFGALAVANGGGGGTVGVAAAVTAGQPGAGGTVGTGNLLAVQGNPGSIAISSFSSTVAYSGQGGAGPKGGGGIAVFTGAGSFPGMGVSASSLGGGGSGAAAIASGAAQVGGAGAQGLIIVFEYS